MTPRSGRCSSPLATARATRPSPTARPSVSAKTFRDVDGVTVSVDVTNTGAVAGKEIVQVYVHDRAASLPRPPKELKGFAKVELQPGETKTVTIPLDFRAFAFYHPGYGQWITEDGEFDILVGASAADIRGVETVTLQSTLDLPSLLTPMATPRQWLADKRGKEVFAPFFDQLLAALAANFASGADAEPRRSQPRRVGLYPGHAAARRARFPGRCPAGVRRGKLWLGCWRRCAAEGTDVMEGRSLSPYLTHCACRLLPSPLARHPPNPTSLSPGAPLGTRPRPGQAWERSARRQSWRTGHNA